MCKIGFIGAGNMGGAIISGMIESKSFEPGNILVCDKIINEEIKKCHVVYSDIKNVTESCDFIVLAVKPANIFDVIKDIRKTGDISSKVFISIAAGVSLEKLKAALSTDKVIRVMPNICLKAKQGMCVLAMAEGIDDSEMETALKIFSCSGKTAVVKEELIDACTAINGSGPAYVFMFIEAMADAAVKHGIDRQTAYMLSAQTVLGSAAMVLETNLHPAVLKDMVCSPGGTTIEAVQALEDCGMRAAVMEAVDACAMKASKMGK
ncbi:MAG: pyrroline-5-carboxylate reductase [Clostridia bacterium]|nr:pyrroline-5-carboxylate reductase [Clostridia bacterium]